MASNSSPLLINESPLQVLPSLAKALGNVNEAIILQQTQYWLKNPKSGRVGEDGRKYIRDTYDEWQQQLTWLSTRTIKSRIKSLQNKGLLLTANLNKSKYDRTNWYSIDYDKLNELMYSEETSLLKVKKVTNKKGSNFTIKSEKSYQPIPKTSSKSSTETSTKKYSSTNVEQRIFNPNIEKDFKKIWELYPNKKGKKQAFNHYKKWRKESINHTNDYLEKKLDTYLTYCNQNRNWYHPMNGSTWFNGRFDDDYKVEIKAVEPISGGYEELLNGANIQDIPDDKLQF